MTTKPIRLKGLLQQRHWQTYRIFCDEYDKAAKSIDRQLMGTWPSRAQFHRWLSGELRSLPYADHCRVLETMFPGWAAAELFEPADDTGESRPAGEATPGISSELGAKIDVFLDMNDEDNRAIAQRIRNADSIYFVAHTGYNALVSQYQAAARQAVLNGCRLKVVLSDPDGPLMQNHDLTRRLCPSIRQAGEVQDVLETCRRHQEQAIRAGLPADNVQVRLYAGPPSMNALCIDGWLRIIAYLPLLDAAESPVFEYQFDPDNPPPLVCKYLISMDRLWDDSRRVDLAADEARSVLAAS